MLIDRLKKITAISARLWFPCCHCILYGCLPTCGMLEHSEYLCVTPVWFVLWSYSICLHLCYLLSLWMFLDWTWWCGRGACQAWSTRASCQSLPKWDCQELDILWRTKGISPLSPLSYLTAAEVLLSPPDLFLILGSPADDNSGALSQRADPRLSTLLSTQLLLGGWECRRKVHAKKYPHASCLHSMEHCGVLVGDQHLPVSLYR